MSGHRLDEDDVRVRPSGRSRPRTRRRPAHAEAAPALVTAVARGRYRCQLDDRAVTAVSARELGHRAVVVGDRVDLVGELGGGDALARIVRVHQRHGALRRSADDADPVERVIVANADRMVIVVSCADPPPRTGLVDRCLVAAYDARVEPLLCLTKADLAPPDELLGYYAPLQVEAVVSLAGSAAPQLTRRLAGGLSALVGHSGVGKSTLVNALVPDAARVVGEVNPVTGRGRHVSTSAVALPLPGGGWVVDTPGVRSFGLGHVRPAAVLAAFPDLARAAAGCPRGCRHTGPSCALDAEVAAGRLAPARLASARRLLATRHAADPEP